MNAADLRAAVFPLRQAQRRLMMAKKRNHADELMRLILTCKDPVTRRELYEQVEKQYGKKFSDHIREIAEGDQPPKHDANRCHDGVRMVGSTGQLWEVKNSKWVRV